MGSIKYMLFKYVFLLQSVIQTQTAAMIHVAPKANAEGCAAITAATGMKSVFRMTLTVMVAATGLEHAE